MPVITGTPRIIVAKFKAADESVTSSTTLQNDDDFNGFAILAGKHYRFRADIIASQGAGAGGLRHQFTFSQAVQWIDGFAKCWYSSGLHYYARWNTGLGLTTLNGANPNNVKIEGVFLANASNAGMLDYQWAQNTSDPVATQLLKGSRFEIERLD